MWRPSPARLLPAHPALYDGPLISFWVAIAWLVAITVRSCIHLLAPDGGAQSIATIAPTVGPALTIALIHESAGAGTWLTYVIATAAMLLVAASINVFASRSASPGALSDVVAQGLGPRAGVVAAWAL